MDDGVDYTKKYTKKVWAFIHKEFKTDKTQEDPDVKWIYRDADKKDKPFLYYQKEFMFTFIWPKKAVIENRNANPNEVEEYIEGEVDKSW